MQSKPSDSFGNWVSFFIPDDQDLKQRQQEHLRNVRGNSMMQSCLHDLCTQCIGTGIKIDGSACIHNLTCSCRKCTPQY